MPTRPEIDRALSYLSERAVKRGDFATVHVIAHVELELFGYDPDCPEGCPL